MNTNTRALALLLLLTFVVSPLSGVASAQRRRPAAPRQQPAGATQPERDGAACDGVYGATTEALANGDYLIEARASAGAASASAATVLNAGAN